MTLLVNTCGWVDGLGKDILLQLLSIVEPDAVVSMKKKVPNQFHDEIRAQNHPFKIVEVENDQFEAVNTKGQVNRNRRLMQCLTYKNSFNEQKFNMRTTGVKSQSFNLLNQKSVFLSFDGLNISKHKAMTQWSDFYYNKMEERILGIQSPKEDEIDLLEPLNGQIVALLNIKKKVNPNGYTVCNLTDFSDDIFICYALVRNIDLDKGRFELILSDDLILQDCCNCIHLCDNKIFNFGTSYMMQPDLQEEILRQAMIDDKDGAQDRYFMNDFAKD